MAHTFSVDEVEPAASRLATRALGERFPEVLALGGDAAAATVDLGGLHPLMAAVHLAFSEHRPLVLSPDAVWLTIAQGVAQHVRLHADRLRDRLVRHSGRKQLVVSLETPFPEDAAGIGAAIDLMRGALADEVGAGRARLFTCDFSTSGEVERVASEIVLLDAFSPYYDLVFTCVCGIPELTVTGTPDDWRAMRRRLDVISELELGWWTPSLAGIVERLADAAAGRPDVAFFRRIYKPQEAYSRDRVTGWIARLWPYVARNGGFDQRNPLLALPLDLEACETSASQLAAASVAAQDVPAGPSSCLFQVRNRLTQARLADVELRGGLLAVEQDERGRLSPRAGWYARRSEGSMGQVLDQIVARHVAELRPQRGASAGPFLLARASGVVRRLDCVAGRTIVSEPDELTGLVSERVRVPDGQRLRPRMMVGEVEHELPDGALPVARDGATVAAGDLLARLETERQESSGPAELKALDDRLRCATLFADGRPWKLRAACDRQRIELRLGGARSLHAERVIDLPDGTFVAACQELGVTSWIRLRADKVEALSHLTWRSTEDAAQVPVVARSLAGLLQGALDSGGSTELPALAMLYDVVHRR